MTDREIANAVEPKGVLDKMTDTLSRMTELAPGIHAVAKGIDLNEESYVHDRDALPPKSAFVIGINMEF